MTKAFYIGRFAPPYGGATIKNEVIFEELLKYKNFTVLIPIKNK